MKESTPAAADSDIVNNSSIPFALPDDSHQVVKRSIELKKDDKEELDFSLENLFANQHALSKAVNEGFASMQKRFDELLLQPAAAITGSAQLNARQQSFQKNQAPSMAMRRVESRQASMAPNPNTRTFRRNAKFKMQGKKRLSNSRRTTVNDSDAVKKDQDETWHHRGPQALHPDSRSKLYWDFLSILFCFWDLFCVPYIFSWSVASDLLFVKASAYTVCIFWTLDLPVNFVTGYYNKEAEVERRFSRSAVRYLRGWFTLDIILATVDWTMLNLDARTAPWAFQAQQIFRICKLVIRVPSKIPRMLDLYARMLLKINNKNYHALLDILRLIFLLIFSNHVLACFWFFVGRHPFLCDHDAGQICEETWLKHPEMTGRSDMYYYLTALHWCVTQMTPASMEVVPENGGERLFTIVIIIIGLLLGTSLIATMAAIVTALRVEMDAKLKNTMQLQRFLVQENVPTEIGMLVMRQVKWRLTQKKRVKVSEVAYINLISHSLQSELKFEIHMNFLYHHNFFGTLNYVDRALTRGVCNMLKVSSMSKDDLLFEELSPGNDMYFVTIGAVRYIPGPDAYEYNRANAITRIEGTSWCSEPALWLSAWVHLGTCIIETQSEILSLDAQGLEVTARKNKNFSYILDKYSEAFELYCNQSPSVSDFPTTYNPADVFHCLELSDRLQLAEGVIENMQRNASKVQAKKYGMLLEEIAAGKCSIAIISGGGVMRTVFLAALRVTLSDDLGPGGAGLGVSGRGDISPAPAESDSSVPLVVHGTPILCEVAEFDSKTGVYRAKCTMPGTKRREQESAASALQRLLKGDLKQLSGLEIDYLDTEDNSFSQLSISYGLQSRYIKTCFNATMERRSAGTLPTIEAAGRDTWSAQEESLEAARQAAMDEKWSWLNKQKVEQKVDVWTDKAQHAEEILKRFKTIMCLDSGNRLYLWLTPEEMEVLQQQEAAEVLKKWISLHKKETKISQHSFFSVPDEVPKTAPLETVEDRDTNFENLDDDIEDVRCPRVGPPPKTASPFFSVEENLRESSGAS